MPERQNVALECDQPVALIQREPLYVPQPLMTDDRCVFDG